MAEFGDELAHKPLDRALLACLIEQSEQAGPDVAAALDRTGFRVDAQLERASYPAEVDTRRGYLLAQRRD